MLYFHAFHLFVSHADATPACRASFDDAASAISHDALRPPCAYAIDADAVAAFMLP